MMKNVDYIIVGSGFAGLFFAHQLIKNKKSFVIFSDERKSASEVSAGIINPVVLKKFTTFWLAKEQIVFLKDTLREIEKYTGVNYLVDERIHRIFHDEKEKELWLSKSTNDDLKDFLNPTFEKIENIHNEYESGVVNHSARLDVSGFFNDFKSFLRCNGYLIEEKFNYNILRQNTYGELTFNNIVFCEGMKVKENPFFKDIPVQPNKGHHLKVALSQPLSTKVTLKKKHFLFPSQDGSYYYGGTYDRHQFYPKVDDSAKEQLIEGLAEFYPYDFEVLETEFGFRPTVRDRRPILGNLENHENYYVFNGLGARGILSGCYFSKVLFDHIEKDEPLPAEVDVKRFNF